MNFREAMECVRSGEVVRVMPKGNGQPYLLRVDIQPDLGLDCLLCILLTEDGQHFREDEVWEPVCYLLCFGEYIDGEWEVVDVDDFTYEEDDE